MSANTNEQPDESFLKFPCLFPIKAMGKSGPELEQAVLKLFRCHVPDIADDAIAFVVSSKGTYTSITVTITAHSKQQLDAIYLDLTACEHVLYAL